MNATNTLGYKYQFTDTCGKHIIPQNTREFYALQGFNKEDNNLPLYIKNFKAKSWTAQQIRLGYKEWSSVPKHLSDHGYYTQLGEFEEKLNRFWEGAKSIVHDNFQYKFMPSFRCYCPLKRFLYNIANEACIEGNIEKYNKAESLIPRGNMLLLPSGN